MQTKSLYLEKLKDEYKTLSEVREKFPRVSQHPVAKYLEERLSKILFWLEQEENNPSPKNKKSKIITSTFLKTLRSPKNQEIYYYEIEFLNGDKGILATQEFNNPKISVGKTIMYWVQGDKIMRGIKKH
jgi:hypothetical protein